MLIRTVVTEINKILNVVVRPDIAKLLKYGNDTQYYDLQYTAL